MKQKQNNCKTRAVSRAKPALSLLRLGRGGRDYVDHWGGWVGGTGKEAYPLGLFLLKWQLLQLLPWKHRLGTGSGMGSQCPIYLQGQGCAYHGKTSCGGITPTLGKGLH